MNTKSKDCNSFRINSAASFLFEENISEKLFELTSTVSERGAAMAATIAENAPKQI